MCGQRPFLLLPWLAATLAAADVTQQPLGSSFRTAASTASRAGLLGAAGILVARFDHDDYVGWGRTTSTPNRRVVRGVTFHGEDKNGASAESYTIHVYTEDSTRPGFPDATAPLLSIGPFTNPTTPAGLARFQITQQFSAPLEVPADRDVFVGVGVQSVSNWPNDGFTVQCVLGAPSMWPTYDSPGNGPIQHGSYGLAIDGQGMRFYNSTRQLLVDLLCDAPGGACTSLSNQPNYPIASVAPGGGGFLSGLHPDVVSPPRNLGRADSPGFTFLDRTLANGSLVLFLNDFGTFGPETRLDTFVPNSIGVWCLSSASAITVAVRPHFAGATSLTMPVGSAVRSVLQGLPLIYQAIGIGPNLALHGSPCGRQVF